VPRLTTLPRRAFEMIAVTWLTTLPRDHLNGAVVRRYWLERDCSDLASSHSVKFSINNVASSRKIKKCGYLSSA
jgi:hypothetical protein